MPDTRKYIYPLCNTCILSLGDVILVDMRKLWTVVKVTLQMLSIILVYLVAVAQSGRATSGDLLPPALLAAVYIWHYYEKKRAAQAAQTAGEHERLKAEYIQTMEAHRLTDAERQQLEETLKHRNLLPSEYDQLLCRETIYLQERKAGIKWN